MSANEEKFLEEFEIKVGGVSYVFLRIPLEKNRIGKWSLPYGTVQIMMKSVAALILADKEKALTFAELEHLAKTTEMSMAKIAELIKKTRSTITKWKNADGSIPYADSYCLKDKLPGIIFGFEDRREDAAARADSWIKSGSLLRPKVA